MITLFHGADIAKSREAFLQERAKIPNAHGLDGSRLSLSDLQQEVSGGLFDTEQKPLFIDGFLSKRKTANDLGEMCEFIKNENSVDIFIWESKELTAKQIEVLGRVTVRKFDLPKQLFAFLDSLRPRNQREMLRLFHEVIQTEAPELVFTMLVRQVRMLLAISNNEQRTSNNTIDEVSRLAPWQKSKLEKQAKQFSVEELVTLHHKLFQIDLKQKTGTAALPLVDQIDFLLAAI